MHIYKVLLYTVCTTLSIFSSTLACNATYNIPFATWFNLCDALPRQHTSYGHHETETTPLLKETFLQTVVDFTNCMYNQLRNAPWLHEVPTKLYLMQDLTYLPYVQKLAVDEDMYCAFHGDLHGDIHALNNFLVHLTDQGYLGGDEGFTIVDDHFYMIFLGDYVDRGWYGAEVLYTVMRLKLANPDRVILVRGNHEDVLLNNKYGFSKELKAKFAITQEEFNKINRLYTHMPVALFLGSKKTNEYILCCHGGIEIGYQPTLLLEDKRPLLYEALHVISQADNISLLPIAVQELFDPVIIDNLSNYITARPTRPRHLGFLWNDFIVSQKGAQCTYAPKRGLGLGKKPTKGLLKYLYSGDHAKVRGVFRAHQHGDDKMMASILNTDNKSPEKDTGISKLWRPFLMRYMSGKVWPGIVCTFLVAPGSVYGGLYNFNYDAFGLLHIKGKFSDWQLDAIRV